MKRVIISLVFLVSSLGFGVSVWGWECEVTLTAPKTIKLDQTVSLSASGTPVGGSYSWSRNPTLTAFGETATLVGYKVGYSEYITVTSTYTTPKGKSCKDTKWLWVCLCTVGISGPAESEIGAPVTLAASADSLGGTYEWSVNSGSGSISGTGDAVLFTGDQAGEVEIKVSYTPLEGGEPCTAYHSIQVVDACAVSISGILQRPT
nr:hypothetical protein [Desulfobulbaceae bacterium]